MTQERPNILLITCDQLRQDFIGAYGCDFIETPNIDRLAREGCTFTNGYSPNPVCIPARHNLITGLTARHHGFDDNYFGAEAKSCPYRLPTFAQILGDHCYETVAIGKMHFQPERRAAGFDYFYNMDELPRSREEDEYALFLKENGYGNLRSVHGVRTALYMQPQRSLVKTEHHGSHWVADRAIDFFRQNHGRAPFLMWAGFIHPHPPFDVPGDWADKYKGKIPPPSRTNTPLSTLARENIQLGCLEDEAVLNRARELYAAAISFVDYNIGRMLEELERQELLDDTLILFLSDHGEMLGDLGTFQKFLPYDASSKIPFLLRWPRRVSPGSRDERFVDLNDVLPTLLDAAGADYPADYDLPGESVLAQSGVKNRAVQYIEHQRGSKRWCSLRDERYKYIYYYGDREQLFDLRADPGETTNLLYGGASDEAGEARDRLRSQLLRYEARYGLKGCVVNGDFKPMPPYELTPYYETNFPLFPEYAAPEEQAALGSYADELLAAIRQEPTVKLRRNHTAEILSGWGGYSGEEIDALLERAERQGN